MRISHEAIYQALYIQGRGALRRELSACLRSGRALRLPRERGRVRGKSFPGDAIMISERPPVIEDRAVPGHWEGDLILGLGSSAIGTLVERASRFTMLLYLPRMEGFQPGKGIKNGPALAGHGAGAVRDAITHTMTRLPEELRKSLTWDQGAEMSQHARLRIDTGLQIYFGTARDDVLRQVREDRAVVIAVGRGDEPSPDLRMQIVFAHEAANLLVVHDNTLLPQGRTDAAVAVELVADREHRFDDRGVVGRPFWAVIISGTRDSH